MYTSLSFLYQFMMRSHKLPDVDGRIILRFIFRKWEGFVRSKTINLDSDRLTPQCNNATA